MVGHSTDAEAEPTDDLPDGIIGIDAYKQDDGGVTDVRVIERDGDRFTSRWLGAENRVAGIGTPDGWTCVGACTVAWSDDPDTDDFMDSPSAAEAVYVDPDVDEWTTATLAPFEVDA